ncbi:MAG: hypothetical protein KF832_06030 [Caldilineaceae bacterium]|nr:hypothetical protein [Caldilineaceae bacterium]
MQKKNRYKKQPLVGYRLWLLGALIAVVMSTSVGSPRLLLAAPAAPTTADAWDPRFGMAGVEGEVTASAVAPNGDLYIGGRFTKAGGMAAQHIAHWDGTAWWPLGDGIAGDVYAIAIDGTDVYVAGDFRVAGSVDAIGIARWDGTAWSAVGDGTGVVDDYFGSGQPGRVYAMLLHDNKLYIGGDFVSVDGVAANNIAAWDGTTWSALGRGMGELDWDENFVANATVYALATDGVNLYAGGKFELAGEATANSIAQWDGNAWSALNGGVTLTADGTTEKGVIKGLAVLSGDLYAGGWFNKAGGKAANHIAVWQNSQWNPLGVGVRAEEYASEAQVNALAVSGNALYVGGRFVGAGNQNIDLLAKWENHGWSEVGPGISDDGYDYVTTLAAGPAEEIYIGGTFRIGGNLRVDNIAQWHADEWSALGAGLLRNEYGDTPATPYAIAVAADGSVFVGGEFTIAGGMRVSNLALWEDGRWVNIGGANARVRDLVVVDNELYVVGEFTQIGGIAANHVARWNRPTGQWSALGAGINDNVYAVAYADGLLYVGGAFKAAGNVTAEDVAYWDGVQWHPFGNKMRIFEVGDQGSEVGTYVNDLLVSGDSVFIAGHFQTIQQGTNTADRSSFHVVHNIVEWQRSTDRWFWLGDQAQRGVSYGGYSGYNIDANTLAMIGNTLYVGGHFNQAGGLAASNLARWEMAAGQWSSLNASLGGVEDPQVNALAAYGTDLYVGGKFLSAGNGTVNFVAQLDTATDSWSALDGGVKWYNDRYTAVTALAAAPSGIYVGGDFDKAGGLSATGFAHWGGELGGGANVTPGAGGVVQGPNGLELHFPAGAVAQESIVNVATLPAPQDLPDSQRALYGFRATASTLNGQPITTFAKPYTVRLAYTDAQLTELGIADPTTLNLLFWNGTAWTAMLPCAGCGVDTVNKVITVVANHFTDFAVTGQGVVVIPAGPRLYLPLVAK